MLLFLLFQSRFSNGGHRLFNIWCVRLLSEIVSVRMCIYSIGGLRFRICTRKIHLNLQKKQGRTYTNILNLTKKKECDINYNNFIYLLWSNKIRKKKRRKEKRRRRRRRRRKEEKKKKRKKEEKKKRKKEERQISVSFIYYNIEIPLITYIGWTRILNVVV